MDSIAEPLLVVGDGPVARALATALAGAGFEPLRWWRRQHRPVDPCAVALLAVRDDALTEVAKQVIDAAPQAPILLHTAGSLSAQEPYAPLATPPRASALFHPMRAITGRQSDSDFRGAAFAIQGDQEACAIALRWVEQLGAAPLRLANSIEAHARYHAACALTANHTLGLVARAIELLVTVGVDEPSASQALAQLFASTASNLSALGLPAALTGPIARGDRQTVAKHLHALAASNASELYRITAQPVIELAQKKGSDPRRLDEISALITEKKT